MIRRSAKIFYQIPELLNGRQGIALRQAHSEATGSKSTERELVRKNTLYLERKNSLGQWTTVSSIESHENFDLLTHLSNNHIPASPSDGQKILYRIKIVDDNGNEENSAEIVFDYWWHKYFSLFNSIDCNRNKTQKELFKLIDNTVHEVIKYKFYQFFSHKPQLERYYFEEARQEILMKLLSEKYHPTDNFSSFRSYVSKMAKNWLDDTLNSKKNKDHVSIDDTELISTENAEDKFISLERKHNVVKAFGQLFEKYLKELWTQNPCYAASVEQWIYRKQNVCKNSVSELLGILRYNKVLTQKEADKLSSKFEHMPEENDFLNDDSYLIKNIICDIKTKFIYLNYSNVPLKKRKEFIVALEELNIDEIKSINKVKQWIHRGLAVLRVKMQADLNEIFGE